MALNLIYLLDKDISSATEELCLSSINSKNANVQNNEGCTALMFAATFWGAKLIKELISAGANINAQDKEGYTALMYAVLYNNIEAVKCLKHADFDMQDNDGHTALMLAAINDNKDMVRHLISRTTLSIKSKFNKMAYEYAVKTKNLFYDQLCVNAFYKGENALTIAIKNKRNVRLIKKLINRGAKFQPTIDSEPTLIYLIKNYPKVAELYLD